MIFFQNPVRVLNLGEYIFGIVFRPVSRSQQFHQVIHGWSPCPYSIFYDRSNKAIALFSLKDQDHLSGTILDF